VRLLRWLRRLIPDLPGYSRSGDLLIAQAVVLRGTPPECDVLLLKRTSPTAWELPGGNVEPNEAPDVAALREVREETGLTVRIDHLQGWYERPGFRPHRAPVYVCTPIEGTLRPNRESYAARFIPVDRLPVGLFPWYRPIIADAVTGVIHDRPVRQRLGVRATLAAGLIHVGEVIGVLP
jgi:8-oxo-dGTP pyrophosphatase MutT (NUDIX family)